MGRIILSFVDVFAWCSVIVIISVLIYSTQELSAIKRNVYLSLNYGSYIATNFPGAQTTSSNQSSAFLRPIISCRWALDICLGTAGNDKMFGSDQTDYILSSSGDDYVLGWNGSDYINGGEGNDILNGGEGGDTIEGGNGNDVMYGGPGNDLIFAGQAKGEILPAHVNSTESPPSKDIIDCGEGYDTVYVDSLDTYYNCELINGTKQSLPN